ncbi:MAG: hypothetical protein BWX71_02531 [Deltaproteobacteria bacterium ADurb.Bin072]|nr:MAG: hypothetical protein BWX71_02531 [Deltaproteobacteria bacterium ADurb.Bin072]
MDRSANHWALSAPCHSRLNGSLNWPKRTASRPLIAHSPQASTRLLVSFPWNSYSRPNLNHSVT